MGMSEQGLAQLGADLSIGLQVVDVALGNASVHMGMRGKWRHSSLVRRSLGAASAQPLESRLSSSCLESSCSKPRTFGQTFSHPKH